MGKEREKKERGMKRGTGERMRKERKGMNDERRKGATKNMASRVFGLQSLRVGPNSTESITRLRTHPILGPERGLVD